MIDALRLRRLIDRLQPRAQTIDRPPLVPLRMAGNEIGHVAPGVARRLAAECPGFDVVDSALVAHEAGETFDERSAFLARTALFLREAGLLGGWRDELLAVRAGSGPGAIAAIERAACRPLGITTSAVHLNAYADPETLIVARRSPHKQIDPGLWDNLVGGMVPNGETVADALAREAVEEAGIELAGIALQAGRKLHIHRQVPEGFQSEIIHIFDATIDASTKIKNRDGEVVAFEWSSVADVVEAIEHDQFTLESALVTLETLTRRSGDQTPDGLYIE